MRKASITNLEFADGTWIKGMAIPDSVWLPMTRTFLAAERMSATVEGFYLEP